MISGYHINNLVKMIDSSVIGFVLQGLDSRIVKEPFAQLAQQVALLPSEGVKICFEFFTPHDIVRGFKLQKMILSIGCLSKIVHRQLFPVDILFQECNAE